MSEYYEAQRDDGFLLSTNPALLNIEIIHQYLSRESYWALHIPLSVVQQSIEHSICFGLYTQDQQIGFARVITDQATFAYLADVFVLPEWRGKGLSKWMMAFITGHPQLQGLRSWMLVTTDAQGLYEQYGFTVHPYPERVMRRYRDGIYKPQ